MKLINNITETLRDDLSIEIKKGYCTNCNRPASYTYFEGSKNDDIIVGDNGYISLCEDCLRKKRKDNE